MTVTKAMTTIFRRILKASLISFLGLFVVLCLAVLAVLWKPEIAINSKTLTWAIKKLGPADDALQWSGVRVIAHSDGFLKDSFSFHWDGLCLEEKTNQAYHVCFQRVELDFKTDLSHLRPRVTVLGPIEFAGGEITADLDRMPPKPSSTKATGGADFKLPSFLKDTELKPIRIEVLRLAVVSQGKSGQGNLLLNGTVQKDGLAVVSLKADGTLSELKLKSAPQSFKADLEFKNPHGLVLASGWRLSGGIDAVLPSGQNPPMELKVTTTATIEEESQFEIDARFHQGVKLATATIKGRASEKSANVTLDGDGIRLSEFTDEVKIHHCELNVAFSKESTYRISCPASAEVPVPPKRLSFFEVPTSLGLFLGGELTSSTPLLSAESELKGDLTLTLDPVLAPLFTGGGSVKAQISGKISDILKKKVIEAETHFFVKIPKFQKVVEKLNGTEWDVPAPLRALKGSFEADASGTTDLRTGIFPSHFNTQLVSQDQALKINASSTFELKHSKDSVLDAKVVLSDVQIELPRLDLAMPPRFTPDDRIESFKKAAALKAKKKPSSLAYQAEVSTPPEHPLKVLSNLATAPIPIDLELQIGTDGKLSGPIRIEKFPVVLFRQKATIDHFTLFLKDPRDSSQVDGLIKIPHGDYTILVYIVGTMEAPRVRVESDPPVPANQLFSVLLYGESQDDLDSTQNASVGNSQAALSAGAMGLASLYLFASTPIQSVLYDPTTGQVTARVSLGGGTTLNLGSNGTQLSSVGLRKRLGAAWSITTAMDPSKENPGTQIVTSFLEWIHRY
jgi:hypothetical protein